MIFPFLAIAFNIKKMCAKMIKEGMNWLMKLFYKLQLLFLDVWEQTIKEVSKISQLKKMNRFLVNEKRRCIALHTPHRDSCVLDADKLQAGQNPSSAGKGQDDFIRESDSIKLHDKNGRTYSRRPTSEARGRYGCI